MEIMLEQMNTPTFENYAYCKSLLLQQCNTGIVNLDDENIDFIVKNATCNLVLSVMMMDT